jgi:hypothetical protein
MGVVTTDRYGWFRKTTRSPGAGQWRAEYSGTDHYAPEVSSGKRPYR